MRLSGFFALLLALPPSVPRGRATPREVRP